MHYHGHGDMTLYVTYIAKLDSGTDLDMLPADLFGKALVNLEVVITCLQPQITEVKVVIPQLKLGKG